MALVAVFFTFQSWPLVAHLEQTPCEYLWMGVWWYVHSFRSCVTYPHHTMRIRMVVNAGHWSRWPTQDHQVVFSIANVDQVASISVEENVYSLANVTQTPIQPVRVAVGVLDPFTWITFIRAHQRLDLINVHLIRVEHAPKGIDQALKRLGFHFEIDVQVVKWSEQTCEGWASLFIHQEPGSSMNHEEEESMMSIHITSTNTNWPNQIKWIISYRKEKQQMP